MSREELLLAVDGLTEGDLTPADAKATRHEMPHTYLMTTARPSRGLRGAFGGPDAILIEPLPLSGTDNIDLFCRGIGKDPLSPRLREVIAGPDGNHRPILVVLALNLGEDVTSVGEVFEHCLRRMVAQANDPEGLRTATLDLCLRTHWATGERTFEPLKPQEPQIRALLDANVLHTTGAVGWQKDTALLPRRVRFFHDLMQTQLTALALVREYGAVPNLRQQVLLTAAAHPDFGARGESGDLLRAWVDMVSSEALSADLDEILAHWSGDPERFDDRVRKGAVLAALPLDRQESVRVKARHRGAAATLDLARVHPPKDPAVLLRLVAEVALQGGPLDAYGLNENYKQHPDRVLFELLTRAWPDPDALRQVLLAWPEAKEHEFAQVLPGQIANVNQLATAVCETLSHKHLFPLFCRYLVGQVPPSHARVLGLLIRAIDV